LKTEEFAKLFANNENVHLIEGNYSGQLGTMLENKTKLNFAGKFLKYNGRAFYTEEVINYIKNNLK
jgi:pyruvate/2-oxoacid:ferredoxin oxidoreductase alpha subunit